MRGILLVLVAGMLASGCREDPRIAQLTARVEGLQRDQATMAAALKQATADLARARVDREEAEAQTRGCGDVLYTPRDQTDNEAPNRVARSSETTAQAQFELARVTRQRAYDACMRETASQPWSSRLGAQEDCARRYGPR